NLLEGLLTDVLGETLFHDGRRGFALPEPRQPGARLIGLRGALLGGPDVLLRDSHREGSRPGLGAGLGDFDGHEGGKSNQPGSGDMGPKAWGSGMWDAPMRTRTACVFGGSHNPTPPRLLQPLS